MGSASCAKCDPGSFSASAGAVICTVCPAGKTSEAGSISQDECADISGASPAPSPPSDDGAAASPLGAPSSSRPIVELEVALPYTLEGFTEVVRDMFKIAMAAAANTGCNCGITKSEVMILVKENAAPPGTRSRLSAAAGITVGVSILVPDVQAGSVLVKSGVLTKDAMDKEMAKQGLEPIDKITSGPMLLSSASNGNSSSTVSSGGQPPADPSPNSGIAVGVVVGVVVGVIALVVIVVVAFLRFRHNKAKAAREVARQQAQRLATLEMGTLSTAGQGAGTARTPSVNESPIFQQAGPGQVQTNQAHDKEAEATVPHIQYSELAVESNALAASSFKSVYKARWEKKGRNVALLVL